MRRLICIPAVLAALLAVGPAIPAAFAAAPANGPRETVTFVSRADLIRRGLITPAPRASRGARTAAAQAICLWDCIYVKNKRLLRTIKPFVTMVQGNGPSTIAIDITRTVRNSFTATVSVSAEIVSAGVGFNVEQSESVAYRSSTSVPNGACWTLRAYNVFAEYGFEVWQKPPLFGSDVKIGTGSARDFLGVEFRLTKAC